MNPKNKQTLSLLVGAVSNRTGLACVINSKVHYKCPLLTSRFELDRYQSL